MTPRPVRPDLRDLKARAIVEAAAQVFAESGFEAARVADVAERAGIGKGTVYEYFRSKEELFLAVSDAFGSGMTDAVLARIEPRPASAMGSLQGFAEVTLAACQEALCLYPLTMEFWSAAATSELRYRLVEEFRALYATRMRTEKLDETDTWTEISYREASFGASLPNGLFTLSNLRNPRPDWEGR